MKKNFLFFISFFIYTLVLQAQQDTIPKNDSIYLTDHSDTLNYKPTFYIIASCQLSIPAYNSYAYKNDENLYYGYAQSAASYSVAGGANLYRGWGVAAACSYIAFNYDGSDFINQASGIFNSLQFPDNITENGTYHLTNYTYMFGITKVSNHSFGDIGARLMMGSCITYIPAMEGITTSLWGLNNGTKETTYYLYSTSAMQNNFAFDFGLYGDIKILKHILIHTSADLLLSKMTVNGSYRLVDNTTGKTIGSGNYSNSNVPGFHRADIISLGVGLGYLL